MVFNESWLVPDVKVGSESRQNLVQREYHIRRITDVDKAKRGDEYVVRVQWEGLDDEDSTWEPVSRIFADAPAVLRKELRRIRPEADMKRALQERYQGLRW